MFEKLQKFWNEHGFEVIVVFCIVFLLFHAIQRLGKKGTYSTTYYYNSQKPLKIPNKRPSKESSGEKECRRVLELLFKKPFPNSRPDFLRNPVTGGEYNLELDCYNAELGLAVEYSGAQHYKYTPFFHKNKEAFLNQKYRDDMKRRMCKDYGINLIEVPYTVKKDEIKNYLIEQLKTLKYL